MLIAAADQPIVGIGPTSARGIEPCAKFSATRCRLRKEPQAPERPQLILGVLKASAISRALGPGCAGLGNGCLLVYLSDSASLGMEPFPPRVPVRSGSESAAPPAPSRTAAILNSSGNCIHNGTAAAEAPRRLMSSGENAQSACRLSSRGLCSAVHLEIGRAPNSASARWNRSQQHSAWRRASRSRLAAFLKPLQRIRPCRVG